jgi:hypothetical protein
MSTSFARNRHKFGEIGRDWVTTITTPQNRRQNSNLCCADVSAEQTLFCNASRFRVDPNVARCSEQTNGSGEAARCDCRSSFQFARSSSLPASHHNEIRRGRFNLAVSALTARYGPGSRPRRRPNRWPPISLARSPQQHARRTIAEFSWTLGNRGARPKIC